MVEKNPANGSNFIGVISLWYAMTVLFVCILKSTHALVYVFSQLIHCNPFHCLPEAVISLFILLNVGGSWQFDKKYNWDFGISNW